MKKYKTWDNDNSKDVNKLGGTDPENSKEEKIYKAVDLVTLPAKVEGTNCFNCLFIKDIKNGMGFCSNKHVMQEVTDRNCCALWDNKGAYRKWKD